MTATATGGPDVKQVRRVCTDIPGPRSRDLAVRRGAEIAGGVGGTYSGNPVTCAAALGVFDEIETHQLIARARTIGDLMVRELRSITATTDVIGEIRGRVAMIAAELVLPGTREPHRDAVAALTRHCQSNGVLTLTAGTFGNVLRSSTTHHFRRTAHRGLRRGA